jgi:hypothetical protein
MTARRWIGYDWLKLIVAIILALLLLWLSLTSPTAPAATAPTPQVATEAVAQVATPPQLEAPAAGSAIPLGNITLRGKADPNARVSVLVNGASVGTATAGPDGAWSLEAALDKPGDQTVVVQMVDDAGKVLAAADPVTISVAAQAVAPTALATMTPTLAPTAAPTLAPTAAPTSAAITAPAITAPADGAQVPPGPIMLSGTGAPGSQIEVLDGDKVLGTVTVGADGTWAYEATPSAGPHTYGVRLVGSTEAPAATVSVAAPAVEPPPTEAGAVAITSPAEGAQLGAGEFTLSGTGAPGSQIEILDGDKVLGTVTVSADGTWSLPVTPSGATASYGARPVGAADIVGRPVRVTFEGVAAQACASLAVNCEAWVTREQGRGLRLRAGAGTSQAIVEVLPIGTQMTLLEGPQEIEGIPWWRVRTIGGKEGWVAGDNLVLQPD